MCVARSRKTAQIKNREALESDINVHLVRQTRKQISFIGSRVAVLAEECNILYNEASLTRILKTSTSVKITTVESLDLIFKTQLAIKSPRNNFCQFFQVSHSCNRFLNFKGITTYSWSVSLVVQDGSFRFSSVFKDCPEASLFNSDNCKEREERKFFLHNCSRSF